VMCCQFNASRRIDRQLEGRCARQGDPGSVETWISGATPRVAELPLLGALGYVPGSGAGLTSLTFAYALLPLAFKAVAALLLWRWRHSLEI